MEAGFPQSLRQLVGPDFGPELVGHDLGHLDRVWLNCREIAAIEGGDPLVLAAASYLHDYHRVLEHRQGRKIRLREVLAPVEEKLARLEFPPHLRPRVLACIAATGQHSFSGDAHSEGLEERVLHDADTLDAIGAVGIARAFMYGGMKQEPMWLPGEGISAVYTPGQAASVIHHFHEKLLRLAGDMRTETGTKLACDRHELIVRYLSQLAGELRIRNWT